MNACGQVGWVKFMPQHIQIYQHQVPACSHAGADQHCTGHSTAEEQAGNIAKHQVCMLVSLIQRQERQVETFNEMLIPIHNDALLQPCSVAALKLQHHSSMDGVETSNDMLISIHNNALLQPCSIAAMKLQHHSSIDAAAASTTVISICCHKAEQAGTLNPHPNSRMTLVWRLSCVQAMTCYHGKGSSHLM